jgi:hypothetical protein
VPLSYDIVYRVTTGTAVSTEELWVLRPFESEDVTFAGTSTQGEPLSTVVYRLGRQLLHDAGAAPTVLEPPPGPTPFDVRLDALGPAPNLVRRGTRQVAGRRCEVYRSAQSLESGALIQRPTAADHVDTCIDAQGLVLEERHVAGGRVLDVRQAVRVTTGAAGHRFLTAGTHVPVNQGGGRVVTITPTSRPPAQPFWGEPTLPPGFMPVGRFAVVPPQPPAGAGVPDAGLVAAVDDVFVRGPDVVVIEQGGTVTGAAISVPTGGTPITLGPLGHGTVERSALASSVLALPTPNTFVRVSGTLPAGSLIDVARSLRQQPGGTIVTAPDLTSDGP